MTDQVKEVFQRIQVSWGLDNTNITPDLCYQSSPDVTGVMLITNDGIPLQTTVDSDTTVQVRYGVLYTYDYECS